MAVEDYLNTKLNAAEAEKNAESWRELQDLYGKKLWHPLTLKLKECINDTNFTKKENMAELHDKFIREFEHRTNPLMMMEIFCVMAHLIEKPEEGIKFLESIKNVAKNNAEANILHMVGMADLKMKIRDGKGRCTQIDEVKVLLDEAQVNLNNLPGVTSVHGPFYKTLSIYLREIGDYAAYYRESLRYLGCIDINKMKAEERTFHAFCLGLAALLGENVYNFGELLSHPILDSLKDSSQNYLIDLLYAFNTGNLEKFEKLRPTWQQQHDLHTRKDLLRQKIRLLALMEMAFKRKSHERVLDFDDIAKTTGVKSDEVEFLVMKALSLGLIRGNVDETEKQVEVTWVQPRVLDKSQICMMTGGLKSWADEVRQVGNFVHDQAKEILIQN